jgi:hypothetical protein
MENKLDMNGLAGAAAGWLPLLPESLFAMDDS